jgi:hypothetical protein
MGRRVIAMGSAGASSPPRANADRSPGRFIEFLLHDYVPAEREHAVDETASLRGPPILIPA